MTNTKPTLGKRLKAKRIEIGLSLRALEPIVNVSFSSLARIERGVGTPTDDVKARVERWLVSGEASPPRMIPITPVPWNVKIERRLARLEAALGIENDEP